MKASTTPTAGDRWVSRPLELRRRLAGGEERVIRGRVERFAGPTAQRLAGSGGVPFAILSHGYRSWMSWAFLPVLARRLAAAGFVVARFDYSGNGIGPDLVQFQELEPFVHDTYSLELEDLEAVRAALAAWPGVDPARGVLAGHSRGAGIALIHTVERGDYRALCEWAGIVEVASWTPEKKARWRARGSLRVPATGSGERVQLAPDVIDDADRNAERFDLERVVRGLETPTLFLHGDRDEGIPLADIERLAALAPDRARVAVIRDAGHAFCASHPVREVSAPLEHAFATCVDFLVSHARPPS